MAMKLSSYQFRGETVELNADTRMDAPGRFAELPNGFTHYELVGPKESRPTILIHGFSIPYYIWDPTFGALTDADIHVLRYDLIGRGFSDRPDVKYDLDLFVSQLFSLVEQLGLVTPVDLVGLSMGGPISIGFCNRYPQLVRKLCLIDPAGIRMTSTILGRLILRPWIGECLFNLFGNRIILSQLTKDFAEPDKFPAYVEMAKVQMMFKGYKRALLSTLRNDPLSDLSTLYYKVGQQDRESLLIWGVEDKLIPFKYNLVIRKAFPKIIFHGIDGAGHIPHYEKPEVVNPILIEFLEE
jgi:pimeloyl-ACP methyl ester carboxylesterase